VIGDVIFGVTIELYLTIYSLNQTEGEPERWRWVGGELAIGYILGGRSTTKEE